MRSQAEVLSALRLDAPPSAVEASSARPAVEQGEQFIGRVVIHTLLPGSQRSQKLRHPPPTDRDSPCLTANGSPPRRVLPGRPGLPALTASGLPAFSASGLPAFSA
jgi:hypothetical protein